MSALLRINQAGLDIIKDYPEDCWNLETVCDAEKAVHLYVHAPLTRNAFSSLCSVVVSIGIPAFLRSGLLKHLNRGSDMHDIVNQFSLLVRSVRRADRPLIEERRAREAVLFTKFELVRKTPRR